MEIWFYPTDSESKRPKLATWEQSTHRVNSFYSTSSSCIVTAFSQNRSFFAVARQERFNKLLWLATEGGLTRVAGRV